MSIKITPNRRFDNLMHNNVMEAYKRLFDSFKKRLEGFAAFNMLFPLVSIYNEIEMIIDGEVMIGFTAAVILALIVIPIAISSNVKRNRTMFLVIAFVYFVATFITGAILLFFITLINIMFFFSLRDIEEIKRLPGYPHFLPIINADTSHYVQ